MTGLRRYGLSDPPGSHDDRVKRLDDRIRSWWDRWRWHAVYAVSIGPIAAILIPDSPTSEVRGNNDPSTPKVRAPPISSPSAHPMRGPANSIGAWPDASPIAARRRNARISIMAKARQEERSPLSFPAQYARTAGFTFEVARRFTVSPDGTRVVFCRSLGRFGPIDLLVRARRCDRVRTPRGRMPAAWNAGHLPERACASRTNARTVNRIDRLRD